jgi:putative integral membrane protein (TIGR02587 family)
MLLTMELWWLGFYIDRTKFLLFTILGVLLVAMISFYEGISDTFGGRDDILDTLVSYFVGFSTAAVMLILIGVIGPGMPAEEIVGKIGLQAVPASFGAVLGSTVLGSSGERKKETRATTYTGQMVLTVAGAVFLAMSVSPTEEMQLIAHQMNLWHTLALAGFTLLITHAFIYAANRGQEEKTNARFFDLGLIFRFSMVSYAVVLAVSFYILWTFGTLDGMDITNTVKATCVLAFPAALGASASKLIL